MSKYVIVARELYDSSRVEKYVKDCKDRVGTYTTDINEAKQLPGPCEARLAADLLNVKINGYTFRPKFIGS